MATSPSVPELVATAQIAASASMDHIAQILNAMDGQNGTDAQIEDLRAATVALELIAIDTFSLFEARSQHHFKRGPFSRKLTALLTASRKNDLANRLHQYYLAINVLKHGKGASYRELANNPNAMFAVKPADDIIADETTEPVGLIDVTVAGFFDGLATTILDAYNFLEKP